jgi:NADPH:quinone reductase-like Zn-dependent oxidoreductase
VAEKPKNLSFAQAAASGVGFLTAWSMVERAGVGKGSYVLVLGWDFFLSSFLLESNIN